MPVERLPHRAGRIMMSTTGLFPFWVALREAGEAGRGEMLPLVVKDVMEITGDGRDHRDAVNGEEWRGVVLVCSVGVVSSDSGDFTA